MQLIVHAGNARSASMEAIQHAKEGRFAEARAALQTAGEELGQAHRVQTGLIQREAAGDKDVWITGGGDLAGQFHEAGALDEIMLTIAPVTLGAGAPLLPRHLESDRFELVEARPYEQIISATYRMR